MYNFYFLVKKKVQIALNNNLYVFIFIVLISLLMCQQGINIPAPKEYFAYANINNQSLPLKSDPLNNFPKPIIFRFVYALYYIPIFHLLTAFFLQFGISVGLYKLFLQITNEKNTSLVSVLFFVILGTRGFVPANGSFEILTPFYASFRQAATLLSLWGIYYLWKERVFVSSTLFSIAILFFHPRNTILMIMFSTFLFLILLNTKKLKNKLGLDMVVKGIIFITPILFSMLLFFHFNQADNITASILGREWWKFILNNEPDDSSAIFHLGLLQKRFPSLLIMSVFAAAFLYKSKLKTSVKGLSSIRILVKSALFESKDFLIWWIIIGGIIFYLVGMILESIFNIIPVQILDVLIPLQMMWRMLFFAGIGSLLLFTKVYLHVVKAICKILIPSLSNSNINLINIAFLLLVIFSIGIYKSVGNNSILNYVDFNHKPYFFFVKDEDYDYRFSDLGSGFFETNLKEARKLDNIGNLNISHGKVLKGLKYLNRATQLMYPNSSEMAERKKVYITLADIKKISSWIKANLPPNSAIINPPYIDGLRAATDRAMYLAEKLDGNAAIFDRKYASNFIERYETLLSIDYIKIPGIVYSADNYIRHLYLNLDEKKIAEVHKKYSNFEYFLTEKRHELKYPILYADNTFKLYQLRLH